MTQKKVISNIEKMVREKNLSEAELNAIVDAIKNPLVETKKFVHKWGKNHVRIGLGSDLHIGSKYVDYSMLDDVFKRWKKEGVDAVYLAGDITEGYNRRKGHSLECELHGADEQVRGVVERVPSIGRPIYFITGDHDDWHWESAGVDIGKSIGKQRSDMFFLNKFSAQILLNGKTVLELSHPAKGTAYAISYHPQKMIESLSGGKKPNILAIGHYHKVEYLFYRNVSCFQTGTFEDQTPWMRRMNLSAHKAAWLVDVWTKRDGSIDKLEKKLFVYYE